MIITDDSHNDDDDDADDDGAPSIASGPRPFSKRMTTIMMFDYHFDGDHSELAMMFFALSIACPAQR